MTPIVARGWRRPPALRHVLAIVGIAAALQRALYVVEVHDHPFWRVPLVDAADYHARAIRVAHGEGLGPEVFYKAPAYTWLVGQVYRITGPDVVAIYILQMLGGVVTALLAAALATRAFGPVAGLVCGLGTGLYGPLPYYENQLLIEPFALATSVGAMYLLGRGPGLARFAGRESLLGRNAAVGAIALGRNAAVGAITLDLAAGALAGLSLQLRPVNLAFVLAASTFVALGRGAWGTKLRRLGCFVLPVVLLLVPTARHNRLASGRFVPISVNGGINFYIGNNPDYDSTVGIRPGLRWEELTQRFGSMDDPVNWQRNFYRAAFQWMGSHPVAALGLELKKSILVWNRSEIDRNQDSSAMRGDSIILRWFALPWSVLGVLGFIGLLLAWRRWRDEPMHLMALAQLAAVVAFFVTSRYRIAAVPWIAMAAGAAVVELWAHRRERESRAALAVVCASALVLVLPPWFGASARDFGRPELERAEVLVRRGDRLGARSEYERAVERHPRDADVFFRYAEHLERMGEIAPALDAYRHAADLAPWSYKPPLALGAALIENGDLEHAWLALSEAERRGDPHGRALYDMAIVREREAEFEAALGLYQRALERPDTAAERVQRHLGAARSLTALQRHEQARLEVDAARAEAAAARIPFAEPTLVSAPRPARLDTIPAPR